MYLKVKIAHTRLLRIIKEEIIIALKEADELEDTGFFDAPDTGYGVGEDIGEEKIQDLFDEAKDIAVRYYSSPVYKARVINSRIVTNEKEFKDFLASLIDEIYEATWKYMPGHENQSHDAEIDYYSSDETYEGRLGKTPKIIVFKNRIAGMTLDQVLQLLVHELSHIETSLISDISVEFGPGVIAFQEELKGLFLTKDTISRMRNKFDDDNEFVSFSQYYLSNLAPDRYRHEEEMRARLTALRVKIDELGEPIESALDFAKKNNYSNIRDRYGDFPAQFLIAVDYTKNLSLISDKIDKVASVVTGDTRRVSVG